MYILAYELVSIDGDVIEVEETILHARKDREALILGRRQLRKIRKEEKEEGVEIKSPKVWKRWQDSVGRLE